MKILLFAILLLASCATSTQKTTEPQIITEALETEWEKAVRKSSDDLYRLGLIQYKILTKGAEYCRNHDHVAPFIGAKFWSKHSFKKEWHGAALSKFGLGDEPQIEYVYPSSPADTSGLKAKDIVIHINGLPVQDAPNIVKMIKEVGIAEPIKFTIRRADEQHEVSVMPVMACKSRVNLLSTDSSINTYSDGDTIQISKGMLNFLESDEEIALIISHELAHNARQYKKKNKIYGYLGGAAGMIIGLTADVALAIFRGGVGSSVNDAFGSAGMEAGYALASRISDKQLKQADYDSLHLMVMAGYEIAEVSTFWQRIREVNNQENKNGFLISYPFSQERALNLEVIQKEVNEKKRNSSSLVP